MIYEYRNTETGAKREIIASMREAPEITFTDDAGTWTRVWTNIGTTVKVGDGFKAKTLHEGGGGPPVAYGLPLKTDGIVDRRQEGGHIVNYHADGTRTDAKFRRIIENKSDARRAMDQTGFKKED